MGIGMPLGEGHRVFGPRRSRGRETAETNVLFPLILAACTHEIRASLKSGGVMGRGIAGIEGQRSPVRKSFRALQHPRRPWQTEALNERGKQSDEEDNIKENLSLGNIGQ